MPAVNVAVWLPFWSSEKPSDNIAKKAICINLFNRFEEL